MLWLFNVLRNSRSHTARNFKQQDARSTEKWVHEKNIKFVIHYYIFIQAQAFSMHAHVCEVVHEWIRCGRESLRS